MPADLAPADVWRLDTRRLGRRVEVYAQVGSTNTLALARGHDTTQEGLAILARAQDAGRGQYGRTWLAPTGSSVLLSVLLFPPPALRRPALLTAWAAVAVAEAILALTRQAASIKWPNDLLLDGKKVCGILIEQRTTGLDAHPLASVVGLGLNVAQSAAFFQEAGLPLGGSLASVTGLSLDVDRVARTVLEHLDAEYVRQIDGDIAALETRWQARLGLLGRSVEVALIDGTLQGRVVALTLAGLTLEVKPGVVRTLAPETIRRVTPLAQ